MKRWICALTLLVVACDQPPPTKKDDKKAASSASAKPSAKPAASAPASAPPVTASAPASGAASTAPATDAPAAGKALVIKAMKLTYKDQTLEVDDKGTLKNTKDGKIVGKIVGSEIQDAEGKWIVRVNADDTIEAQHTEKTEKDGKVVSSEEKITKIGKFIEGDVIEGEKGKMSIGDDGAIVLTKTDGTKDDSLKEMKFEGVTAETRRTAALVLIALTAASEVTMGMSDATAEAVPPGSATPSTSAAPADKPAPPAPK